MAGVGRRSVSRWFGSAAAVALTALSLVTAPPAAEAATTTPTGGRRPVVGLVLSGGGALGATHIGVLKVLEELKVPVDIVTGTSMGSIVGGLYALGLDAHELESLVSSIDWGQTFKDNPPRSSLPSRRKQEDYGFLLDLKLGIKDGSLQLPAGIIQGQRLTLMLRDLTTRAHSVTNFDKLPIRYRAVAADLETGKAVVLKGGNLATAMRASMSVPGFFPPVEIDGKLLVDGGVANNLPVDVARAMGAEVLIVVDIPTVLKKRDRLKTSVDIAGQMLSVLIQQNSLGQIASLGPRDILIQPDLGERSSADFDKIQEMIPPGEVAARKRTAQLQALALDPVGYAALKDARGTETVETPVIRFIEFDNRTKLSDARLRAGIRQKIGQPMDVQQIEKDFSELYGSGLFEQIDYQLVERDGKTGMVVTATEKAWAKDYLRVGLALESDLDGDSTYLLGVGFTLTALNSYGAEWRNEIAFGSSQQLLSEFYQPLQPESGFYLLPSINYVRDDVRARGIDGTNSEYRTIRGEGRLMIGYEASSDLDARVGLRFGVGEVDRRTGTGVGVDTGRFQIGAADLQISSDTLDDTNFPNEGHLVFLEMTASRDELGADDDYVRAEMRALQAMTWGDNTVIVGMQAGTSLSGTLPIHDRFQAGGLFNLSGYARNELSTENIVSGRMLYMRRLSERSPLFLDFPLYLGGSLEAARLDKAYDSDSFSQTAFGASVFLGADTPLGPGYLAVGHGDGGRTAGYIYFGRLF